MAIRIAQQEDGIIRNGYMHSMLVASCMHSCLLCSVVCSHGCICGQPMGLLQLPRHTLLESLIHITGGSLWVYHTRPSMHGCICTGAWLYVTMLAVPSCTTHGFSRDAGFCPLLRYLGSQRVMAVSRIGSTCMPSTCACTATAKPCNRGPCVLCCCCCYCCCAPCG